MGKFFGNLFGAKQSQRSQVPTGEYGVLPEEPLSNYQRKAVSSYFGLGLTRQEVTDPRNGVMHNWEKDAGQATCDVLERLPTKQQRSEALGKIWGLENSHQMEAVVKYGLTKDEVSVPRGGVIFDWGSSGWSMLHRIARGSTPEERGNILEFLWRTKGPERDGVMSVVTELGLHRLPKDQCIEKEQAIRGLENSYQMKAILVLGLSREEVVNPRDGVTHNWGTSAGWDGVGAKTYEILKATPENERSAKLSEIWGMDRGRLEAVQLGIPAAIARQPGHNWGDYATRRLTKAYLDARPETVSAEEAFERVRGMDRSQLQAVQDGVPAAIARQPGHNWSNDIIRRATKTYLDGLPESVSAEEAFGKIRGLSATAIHNTTQYDKIGLNIGLTEEQVFAGGFNKQAFNEARGSRAAEAFFHRAGGLPPEIAKVITNQVSKKDLAGVRVVGHEVLRAEQKSFAANIQAQREAAAPRSL